VARNARIEAVFLDVSFWSEKNTEILRLRLRMTTAMRLGIMDGT
jgi:hypothetical protein